MLTMQEMQGREFFLVCKHHRRGLEGRGHKQTLSMPRHLIAPLRAVYAAWMANTSGKTVPAATMPIEVAHAKSRKAEQVANVANGVSL